jgi:RNA polymerase sigma-70 factor (ECF subfamily)
MTHVSLTGSEEQRLIKRLQEGDITAAKEFYTRYADSLTGVCLRYIADKEDVKDVVQNALVHIFTHIADFDYRKGGSLWVWTKKVVVNESLKYLRSRKQHEELQENYEAVDEADDDALSVSDIPPDMIRQLLNRLPTGYRTVLNLFVFEGMSHQEIARLLGIKKSSSASQLSRAKKLLAEMIKKYNDNNSPR